MIFFWGVLKEFYLKLWHTEPRLSQKKYLGYFLRLIINENNNGQGQVEKEQLGITRK